MSLRFLLTDDDVDDRELFMEALNDVGTDIICDPVSDAPDMMARLETSGYKKPDLILLDINLPEMSGWEYLKLLKSSKKLRDIPVLMYSTSSHERDRQIAKDLGAVGLITKPSDFTELKNILFKIVKAVRENKYEVIGDL